jgi:hypothetical protein
MNISQPDPDSSNPELVCGIERDGCSRLTVKDLQERKTAFAVVRLELITCLPSRSG